MSDESVNEQEDVVLCGIDERGIATVTLNRPAVNNAYNGAMIASLAGHCARLRDDPAVRLLILRGAGRHFQAGADLGFLQKAAAMPPEENLAFSELTLDTVEALRHFPRPTLALVHGGCFGGGIGLVAACDMAIATEDATFALTEVRWGVTPAPILAALIGTIGLRAVGRYGLTAERFDAAEALRLGLVHAVCPPGGLDPAAAPLIDGILAAAPEATAATKRLAHEVAAESSTLPPELRTRLAREAAERRRMPEAAEGLASFFEKRRPRWYPSA